MGIKIINEVVPTESDFAQIVFQNINRLMIGKTFYNFTTQLRKQNLNDYQKIDVRYLNLQLEDDLVRLYWLVNFTNEKI